MTTTRTTTTVNIFENGAEGPAARNLHDGTILDTTTLDELWTALTSIGIVSIETRITVVEHVDPEVAEAEALWAEHQAELAELEQS